MKWWMYLIILAFLGGLGAAGYVYFDYTQKQIVTMATDVANLETENKEQDVAIKSIQEDNAKMVDIAQAVEDLKRTSQQAVNDLADKFKKMTIDGQRDIGNLAQARPESIERIVNNGTEKVFRCLEISTGATLTEEERKEYDETGKIRSCPGTVLPQH